MLSRELIPSLMCTSCGEQQKRVRGCEAPPQQPVMFDGAPMERCPMRPWLDDPASLNDVFKFFRWYRQGLLPDEGGIIDQSNTYVSAMLTVDRGLDDAMSEKQKKAERERNAKNRKGRTKQPARRRASRR